MASAVRGVHLVGSIRLPHEAEDPLHKPPSTREVIQFMSEALPDHLKHIPDGETGSRFYFVGWQHCVFEQSPWILNDNVPKDPSLNVEAASKLDITLGDVGYDRFAIESYSAFESLQKQGHVHPDIRFQVCIPSAVNAVAVWVHPDYQAKVEPMYEKLLCDAIRNIQTHIPLEKLAIQIDCAVDLALLEKVMGPGNLFKPWFEPSLQAITQRIATIANVVDPAVKLGFHLCYGDMEHQHFKQPRDTLEMVKLANAIAEKVSHPMDFIHMPVPKDRDDDAYFAPLKKLELSAATDVYLGLAHAHDLEGTQRRILAAQKVIPQFGVSTECGLGRTPVEDIRSILEILKTTSKPVQQESRGGY